MFGGHQNVLRLNIAVDHVRPVAEGHALDLDEVRTAQVQELGVLFHLLGVPPLHQSEAVHRALALLPQRGQGGEEALPEVPEQRAVDLLQRFLRRRVLG